MKTGTHRSLTLGLALLVAVGLTSFTRDARAQDAAPDGVADALEGVDTAGPDAVDGAATIDAAADVGALVDAAAEIDAAVDAAAPDHDADPTGDAGLSNDAAAHGDGGSKEGDGGAKDGGAHGDAAPYRNLEDEAGSCAFTPHGRPSGLALLAGALALWAISRRRLRRLSRAAIRR